VEVPIDIVMFTLSNGPAKAHLEVLEAHLTTLETHSAVMGAQHGATGEPWRPSLEERRLTLDNHTWGGRGHACNVNVP
jgi:hypothetical protein